jgi:hypothetical protein
MTTSISAKVKADGARPGAFTRALNLLLMAAGIIQKAGAGNG